MVTGLTKVHTTNRLYDLVSTINESLELSAQTLGKVSNQSDVQDIKPIFAVTYGQADSSISQALLLAEPNSPLASQLTKTNAGLDHFIDQQSSRFRLHPKSLLPPL